MKWGKYAVNEIKEEEENDMMITPGFRVMRTWLAGDSSIAMTIPKSYAKKHKLTGPGHVLCIDTEEGILIKRLEL